MKISPLTETHFLLAGKFYFYHYMFSLFFHFTFANFPDICWSTFGLTQHEDSYAFFLCNSSVI